MTQNVTVLSSPGYFEGWADAERADELDGGVRRTMIRRSKFGITHRPRADVVLIGILRTRTTI